MTWQHRPFPDANLLLLGGRPPALVDSGFVGHAQDTAAWTRAHTGHVALVINDGQILGQGDADWQVLRHPRPHRRSPVAVAARGATAGRRRCALGHDVGWVNLALDGPEVAAIALAYLHARAWLADAARLLSGTPEALPQSLSTRCSPAAPFLRGGRLHAAAEHTPVAAASLRVPFPRAWPSAAPTTAGAAEPQ